MKIRLVEQYDPIKDTTIWWTERQLLGVWWPYLVGMVESSVSHRQDEARAYYERIKKSRSASKTRKVVDEATL